MEPNVDRGMWSVVVLLAAIVIGGVVLLAFPKINGLIMSDMDNSVNKAFGGEPISWIEKEKGTSEDNSPVVGIEDEIYHKFDFNGFELKAREVDEQVEVFISGVKKGHYLGDTLVIPESFVSSALGSVSNVFFNTPIHASSKERKIVFKGIKITDMKDSHTKNELNKIKKIILTVNDIDKLDDFHIGNSKTNDFKEVLPGLERVELNVVSSEGYYTVSDSLIKNFEEGIKVFEVKAPESVSLWLSFNKGLKVEHFIVGKNIDGLSNSISSVEADIVEFYEEFSYLSGPFSDKVFFKNLKEIHFHGSNRIQVEDGQYVGNIEFITDSQNKVKVFTYDREVSDLGDYYSIKGYVDESSGSDKNLIFSKEKYEFFTK